MALKDEFADDLDLANHLEDTKAKLQTYFKQNYSYLSSSSISASPLSSVASTSMSSISSSSGSPQNNFTARFQRKHTSPDCYEPQTR